MTGHAYTDSERAAAVGLALSLGDADEAAKRTGVSRRTISRWIAEVRTGEGPTARIIPAGTREQVAARLWQAVETGASEVTRRMVDPGARLGDVASALRVSIEAHALLSGQATSRSESFTVHATVQPRDLTAPEKIDARRWLDSVLAMTDDELRQHYAEILPVVIESERMARAFEAGDADAFALLGDGKEPTDGLG